MDNFKFGDRVDCDTKYFRRYTSGDTAKFDYRKEWQTRKVNIKGGIFLGTRTLANGNCNTGWEESTDFYGDEYFKAALVCPGPRLNPIYVPLESLRANTGGK